MTEVPEEKEIPEEVEVVPEEKIQKPIIRRLIKKVSNEDIIKNLFLEKDSTGKLIHPILVFTTEKTIGSVPEKYDLYLHYIDSIKEIKKIYPSIKTLTYQSIHNILKSLEIENFVVNLKDLFADKFLYYDYSRTIKALKPRFIERGKKLFFYGDEGKKEGEKMIRASIYVLAKDINPKALIEREINEIHQKYIEPEAEIIAEIEEIEIIEEERDWRADLERFENQRLKTDDFSIQIYYHDIVNFLEEMFHRKCKVCGTNILTPNKAFDMEKPIDNENDYENLKEGQRLYMLTLDEAENTPSHPFSKYSSKTKKDFARSLKQLKTRYFECPECKKKGMKTLILKARLLKVEEVVDHIILGINANKSFIIYGYPGDGKSSITHQFLQYLEWRYGTPFAIYNVDETTTAERLNGGYSPMSFATREKIIRYGIITKSLLKRGFPVGDERVGLGANVMLDEINRTDFENISFLMGFFESPYQYTLEEESRIVYHPNYRSDLGFEHRWVFCATMNIQDIGNNPISLAFKSRFHIIRIRYREPEILEILELLHRLSEYEKTLFRELFQTIQGWRNAKDIRFPAGIRHYDRFFSFLRNGLANMILTDNDILISKYTSRTLEDLFNAIMRSTIMMPIIDENRPNLVDIKEKSIAKLSKDFSKIITLEVIDNNRDLDVLETILYK